MSFWLAGFYGLLALFTMLPFSAFAIRESDMSGDDAGAIVVYKFDEVGGTIARDTSGMGSPLDLTMSTEGNLPTADLTAIRTNAVLQDGYLLINPKPNGSESSMPDQGYESAQRHRTFLISEVAASKLSEACTSGLTIQAFVRPWFPFQGSQSGNMIVGLSNSLPAATQVAYPNFALYQSGEKGAESALLKVRTASNSGVSQASAPATFSSVREAENPGALSEIIATQEPSGVLTVYVNRIAVSSLKSAIPVFSPDAKLVIGNELVPLAVAGGVTDVSQQQNWSGEIHHLAIYCRGFTRTEILGTILQNKAKAETVSPQLGTSVSAARSEARRLVERLSGSVVPIDHPMVIRVEQRLVANDRLGATRIITGDLATSEAGHPDFLNIMVKQFAMKISNREETIRASFNDFAAAFIGIARDEASAQDLLTKDFYYMADPTKAKVRADLFNDLLVSNNHYQDLENNNWDIGKVLTRKTGQQIALTTQGGFTPSPDPAGVLTSRAFMEAHAVAGTNRRIVEYAFRAFMCMPMNEMADTSASPARIGRDVDRLPGGDATKFETSCKGCHTVMDGFRGAFAHYDFNNLGAFAYVRNTEVSGTGTLGFSSQSKDANGTVLKMNHNESVFPDGYVTLDNSFVNNAVGTANRAIFGWNGTNKLGGIGAGQFGRMMADSDRFAQCMAKRAFEQVCTPAVIADSKITDVAKEIAATFKSGGYKLRSLFQLVATNPACASGMGK